MADVLHIKISWDQICRYVNCKVENMPSAATVPKSCLSWICPGVEEDCPRSSNCKFSITTLHQVQSVGQSVGVTNFLNCRNRWLNLLKKILKMQEQITMCLSLPGRFSTHYWQVDKKQVPSSMVHSPLHVSLRCYCGAMEGKMTHFK